MSDDAETSQEQEVIYFCVEEFLKEYEKFPCLWDKNHVDFRKRIERAKCEINLGATLGIYDTLTLRRKIRSVRGVYNTEIRKIKHSLENGYEVYPPKLSWFPLADKFLRVTTDLPYDVFPLVEDISIDKTKGLLPKLTKRKTISIIVLEDSKKQKNNDYEELCIPKDDDETENNIEDEESEEFFKNYEELELESLQDNINDACKNESLDQTEFEEIEHLVETGSSVSQQMVEESSSRCEQRSDKLSKRTKSPDRSTKKDDLGVVVKYLKTLAQSSENEFSAFGRSVAIQLQNMPLELALQLQMDIQAHITKSRIDFLLKKN